MLEKGREGKYLAITAHSTTHAKIIKPGRVFVLQHVVVWHAPLCVTALSKSASSG